jgi:chromosome partitioning protein
MTASDPDHPSAPVTTDRFARAAAFAARGREELARAGHAPDGQRHLRRFSLWEVCRFLIPVSQPRLRQALRDHPTLPQGRGESGAKWFTLEEVLALRAHFAGGETGVPGNAAGRPAGADAKVLAVCNFKGGVGKTTTAAHLAMAAALDGYRVLVIDLDSQGSMTSILGGQVSDEWQTAFPLLARHYARHLEEENSRRAARGQPPLEMDETVTEARGFAAKQVIQKTHWPGIDLIGAQLNLYWAEFQVPVWRMGLRSWPLWDALTGALQDEGLLQDYDLVLLDTPPALGYLTINALAAADILLVPLGAAFLEFDSTGRFFDMLNATFASIEEGENSLRRREGLPEIRFEWDAVRTLVTRYDAAQQGGLADVIGAYFGDLMAAHRQEATALVGQAGEQVAGIYEADYRDFNRDTYVRGRETFDATWTEIRALLQAAWWRDARLAETPEAAPQAAVREED